MNSSNSSRAVCAVLFDLDGTLIDTAPDFLYCLNILRKRRSLPDALIHEMRHHVSHGSMMVIRKGLGIEPSHSEFEQLRQEFLELYVKNISSQSAIFTGIELSLVYLHQQGIPWGIVTNKPERFTTALLANITLPQSPHCVVCGDTTAHLKPHPDPIFFACKTLNIQPEFCLFIGDSVHDMTAAKAANMPTILAQYGYIDPLEDISRWQADYKIQTPAELHQLLHQIITGLR